jgi:hypothetical protein
MMNRSFESAMNHLDLLKSVTSSTLCQHLLALQNTLPSDAPSQAFKALLDAITGALLSGEKPADLALRIAKAHRKKHVSLNPLTSEQAKTTLSDIKKLRNLATDRNATRGSRKLDRYRQEIGALYNAKASQRDIRAWLKREKRLKVSQPTIQRYLSDMKAHGEIE